MTSRSARIMWTAPGKHKISYPNDVRDAALQQNLDVTDNNETLKTCKELISDNQDE